MYSLLSSIIPAKDAAGMDPDATVVSITWKIRSLKHSSSTSSHWLPFGCHSVLEIGLSDGSIWQTQKGLNCNQVQVDFTPGTVNGEVFRGPMTGQDLKKQGWIWTSPTTAADLVKFVDHTSHAERYCVRDFNCHTYAQDVWNFCVTFSNRVWWRPDFIKAKVFGGLAGASSRVGYDDDCYDDYDDHDYDYYDDIYDDDY